MPDPQPHTTPQKNDPWYAGITRYQWLVLIIASAGWVFDVFEGQIFVASMNEAMPSLVPKDTTDGQIKLYNNIALSAFLLGGAIGGIVFGMLSDRIGRKKTLSITIMFYSVFTALSIFAQDWWHLAALRFLVALGTGGEWAVASTLVAEVFPRKARAHVGSIFHASSTLGTYLAVAAGTFLIGNAAVHQWATSPSMEWVSQFFDPATLPWRLGFAIGILPALMIVWIRLSIREPESWQAARNRATPGEQLGQIPDLFRGVLLKRTIVGLLLATVGLATFWGTFIYGKNILKEATKSIIVATETSPTQELSLEAKEELFTDHKIEIKRWEMLGMFLVATGGGIGLLSFGPLSQRIGRRGAFLFFEIGGFISAILVFQVITDRTALIFALPIFGFLALGMHAGFAIYFPELYPTRLRGSGTGFCFNGARVLTAPILVFNGVILNRFALNQLDAAALFSILFLFGIIVLIFAPETRGRELPE